MTSCNLSYYFAPSHGIGISYMQEDADPSSERKSEAIMAGPIHRVTLFKVPSPTNQQKLIDAYKVLAANSQKVRV